MGLQKIRIFGSFGLGFDCIYLFYGFSDWLHCEAASIVLYIRRNETHE